MFVPTYEWQLLPDPAVLKQLDTNRVEVRTRSHRQGGGEA